MLGIFLIKLNVDFKYASHKMIPKLSRMIMNKKILWRERAVGDLVIWRGIVIEVKTNIPPKLFGWIRI